MNRDELDAFFAKADDVLADWHGGTDAMHARVPDGDEPELPPRVDSYYDQGRPTSVADWAAVLGPAETVMPRGRAQVDVINPDGSWRSIGFLDADYVDAIRGSLAVSGDMGRDQLLAVQPDQLSRRRLAAGEAVTFTLPPRQVS